MNPVNFTRNQTNFKRCCSHICSNNKYVIIIRLRKICNKVVTQVERSRIQGVEFLNNCKIILITKYPPNYNDNLIEILS